jgi:predicted house-cleaning noncanonical NTP pyrophosphatase (MazG superfamily)
MIQYHKAIRDKIPEIIDKTGKEYAVKTLSDGDFLTELEKKLHEEIKEYYGNRHVEELVDVIEVIYRIAELREVSLDDLESMRIRKREERGAFSKNLFLVEAEK